MKILLLQIMHQGGLRIEMHVLILEDFGIKHVKRV